MISEEKNKETNNVGYKVFTLRKDNDSDCVYVVELSPSAEKFLDFLIEYELCDGFSCDDGNTVQSYRF